MMRANQQARNSAVEKQVVQLEDELAVVTMGSKDCCLSNFTLF
jgi:hypothetical protein